MAHNKRTKYLLMVIHIAVLLLTVFVKSSGVLSYMFGLLLLAVSLLTVVYTCYLAVNNDFYFQMIPIIFIIFMTDNIGWDYVVFTDNTAYLPDCLIVALMIIALFVGLKCKTKKQNDCVTPTVAVFILLAIFTITTTNTLNVVLSTEEPYQVQYTLIEKTDEYIGSHPTAVSTQTYKVSPITEKYGFDIEELEVKQSFNVDTSDVVTVEIRIGLFENVYRVLEKAE